MKAIIQYCAGILSLCIFLSGCGGGKLAVKPGPGVFFVATNGNDKWSGKLPKPNPDFTDGPFATIERARNAVRQFKSVASNTNINPKVWIGGGIYFLTRPIELTGEDSASDGLTIHYSAMPDEKPIISGGRKLTGWKQVVDGGKKLWMLELPEVREGKWFFHQLWVNGAPRPRSRHPNTGCLPVESVPDATNGVEWTQGQSRFVFKAGDIGEWKDYKFGEIRVMNRWIESHLPIMSIDYGKRMLMFRKRSVFKLEPGDLYYIENVFEALDAPGEWYLDAATGKLYYYPNPGEEPDKTEVVAPVLSQLVIIKGDGTSKKFVQSIVFDGLTFSHAEWYFPDGFDRGESKVEIWPPPKAEVGGFAQAAVGVPGAVKAEFLRNSVFTNCNFINIGSYAIELGRGCQSNKVTYCNVQNLGAGGIKIGETSIRSNPDEIALGNEVSDCHIHNGGLIFHSAIGIWIGQSPSNLLIHNHIHDFYYTGISIGWTWGYTKALATNNIVEFNHVHHIGVKSDGDGPILSDMGGIYTLGLHTGSKIRHNLWHDIQGLRYGGWGIYFDEGTTGILAENNLVYRTTHGGFHQHYGKDNIVRNNIFAFAKNHQIQRSRAETHLSFIFEKNIVYWRDGKLLDGNYSGTNFIFRSNLYWNVSTTNFTFDKYTFEDWQKKKGQDSGSIIANPMFEDIVKDNYKFKQDSPVSKIGFAPFNYSNSGVRPKK
ncbi:MAG: right-handed parallel beta-helix repeat-containing protein [Verrucomicrobiae bacterium]|nr:right-handed parallel beta-helix repeat-containing protein [Verrucomicrobiae bacterium]